jgi:hypothetical protein
MDINKDQWDQQLGKIIKEHGYEQPPSEFARQVLLRLAAESKVAALNYVPLFPVWSWLMIIAVTVVLFSGILGGFLPGEMAVLNWVNMDVSQISRLLPTPNSLEITSPYVYGAITLAFFVYLQLILLRHIHFTRQLSA